MSEPLDPPIPDMDEFETLPNFWANDDGDYWVAFSDAPTLIEAWRSMEAFLGMPLEAVSWDPVIAKVADCEMGHSCLSDPADYPDLADGFGACDAHPECPRVRCPEPWEEKTWHLADAAEDAPVGRWAVPPPATEAPSRPLGLLR